MFQRLRSYIKHSEERLRLLDAGLLQIPDDLAATLDEGINNRRVHCLLEEVNAQAKENDVSGPDIVRSH